MADQPLDSTMRMRVIVVLVSSAVLFLVGLPLEIIDIARHSSAGDLALSFGIGVGFPAFFLVAMWFQVRRWRRNPDVRRRQPTKKATQILLVGTLVSLFLGNLARGLAGGNGWVAWLTCLVVLGLGSFGTIAIARRVDPRLHFFRRPDPLPEGQEPDQERAPTVW